jgi:ADP-heptose:LPS heptosyltransferase
VKKPILVIQMHRMGDLILSFPLFLWLERAYPGHPVWVMAEPSFAAPLGRLSPAVRYLGYGQGAAVVGEKFRLVVNLSHRHESMELAGRLQCEELVGAYVRGGATRVNGAWQEYRLSLTHNNRHNRFHWADLNALDVIPAGVMAATRWPEPRTMPGYVRQVGLFLGASEPDKRPSAAFWADLVGEVEKRGFVPVLLGGPAEKDLGSEVRRLAGRPVASACGTLGLDRFAMFGQRLAALVTPDTGPMHLAAWSGLRVLNLSMGPVHAWETGPYQPGHLVLRSARDCVGCWRCRLESPRCHDPFSAARVAGLLETALRAPRQRISGLRLPGLEVFASGRMRGLYHLAPLSARPKAGHALGAYWQAFWLHAFGAGPLDHCREAASDLRQLHAPLARVMAGEALRFVRALATSRDPSRRAQEWAAFSPSLRPLSGYCAAYVSNRDGSAQSVRRVLALAEEHVSMLAGI